jgi:ferritin-like metal-binding protein YciE
MTSDAGSPIMQLFQRTLKDMYSAEQLLPHTLGELRKSCMSAELSLLLLDARTITNDHLARLEHIFKITETPMEKGSCGMLEDIDHEISKLRQEKNNDVHFRELALIGTTHQLLHYKIAGYGNLSRISRKYGYTEAADLLTASRQEEEELDMKLNAMAEEMMREQKDQKN